MRVLRGEIAIVGMGYVGLPLGVEFGEQFRTVGFHINAARIDKLLAGRDSTLEAPSKGLKSSKKLHRLISQTTRSRAID
jgi:UDP-N-acetyl-D-galactosamine dehydrogenase